MTINTTKPHGTRARYQAGCACEACTAANSRACKLYRLRGGATWVNPDLAAAHLATLRRTGMSWGALSAASGLATSALSRIPTRTKIRPETARAILAITPASAPEGWLRIGATGTQRRIQALAALGYSFGRIAQATGTHRDQVQRLAHGDRTHVTASTAARINAAYRALSMTPPPGRARYDRASRTRTIQHAQRNGWAPPLAWNDATIDDPAARPSGAGYQEPTIADQARELAEMGLTIPAIAGRLGAKQSTVERALGRTPRGHAA